MSGKDLMLVPQCVLDKDDTTSLDLSVNNLQRLPTTLWALPLRELDLSHNHSLGRLLLSVLAEAAGCTGLRSLWLRDMVPPGARVYASGFVALRVFTDLAAVTVRQ